MPKRQQPHHRSTLPVPLPASRCRPGPTCDRPNTCLLAAVVLVVATALAACGRTSDGPVATGGSPSTDEASLPTLPPVAERAPDLFDERGCAVVGPDQEECATTAAELDAQAAGSGERDERMLEGFVGSRWNDSPAGSGPIVLVDTVTVSATGDRWRAVGLARNEGRSAVSGLRVRAVLGDTEGAEIGRAESVSPVPGIRAGEPVPFVIETQVAGRVDSVRWETEAIDAPAVDRAWELGVYWTRPFGDPRTVTHHLFRDEGEGRPHLVHGGAINRGREAAAAPRVAVAFVAPSGRVVHVAVVDAVGPTGEPRGELPPGGTADFLVAVADGDDGPQLVDTTPMLWGVTP